MSAVKFESMNNAGGPLFTLLFVLFALSAISQGRNNHWLFGDNNDLELSVSPPIPISSGTLINAEAPGCISDQAGDLLFYSNGDTVWTANGQIMMNGTGIMGDPGQMIIVPDPGNNDQYYLFSVDNYHPVFDPDASFGYSIIDMNANNGSGEVVAKNILLDTLVSEKVSAILDEDGNGYWIVVHKIGNNEFNSYHLTPFGLSASPVISNSGVDYPITGQSGWAQLQFSTDGSRMATWISEPSVDVLQFFEFSRTSGLVSNAIEVQRPIDIGFNPVGIELSPSGQMAYTTSTTGGVSWLHQIDLSIWDSLAIQNSLLTIDSLIHLTPNALWVRPELATNGKIYIVRAFLDTIAVINDPDLQGQFCNFNRNGLVMPNGVNDTFPNQINIYHDDDVGILETPHPSGLQLYPNPARAQLTLQLPPKWADQKLELQWHDARGRLLKSDLLNYAPKVELETKKLETGIYLLSLYGDAELLGRESVVLH